MNKKTIAGLSAALALTVTMTASPAMAKDGDVIRRGDCSGATNWKLKASPENGQIEVEGEIDSNRNGQLWRWRMRHNGDLSFRGKARTQPPSGSFERRRVMSNMKGTDTITFIARHRRTGEVCRGTVRF